MVVSHITKAIAKITAKKIVKSSDSAVNNKRKLTPEQIKHINKKYDQDSHVQTYYQQKHADIDARYEGTARVDSLTNRIVDPDSKHILSQDLLANPDDMWGRDGRMKITNKKVHEARVRQIKKAEKAEESTPEYKAMARKNKAKYKASEKKWGKAKSVSEMTKSERDDGYQEFQSPNKIKIVSRDSPIGKKIKDGFHSHSLRVGKGVVPIKSVYGSGIGAPDIDLSRIAKDGSGIGAPEGFIRARYADEPVSAGWWSDGPYGHINPDDVPIFGSTATGDKNKKISWWQKLNTIRYEDGSIGSAWKWDEKKKVAGYAYGITGKKKYVKKSKKKKKVGKQSLSLIHI